MIKLSYLEFKKQQKIGQNAAMSEIASDMFGEMQLDGATVRVGRYSWPLSSVERWIEATKEEQGGVICPECKGWFQNATGLGAHRAHKHQVKGARSK